MAYAILRVEKLKTLEAITGAGNHNHRKNPTPNADPAKGFEIIHGTDDLSSDVGALLPKKIRANGVRAVQLMLSASPEWFRNGGSVEDWTDMCVAWLDARYGRNCVNITRHDDESTPHIHAVVVPIKPDGRLSCDHFFGTPEKLSKLQDDFADSMAKFGLMRGVKRSLTKRSHQSIRRFYALCNEAESRLDVGQLVATLHQANTNKAQQKPRPFTRF